MTHYPFASRMTGIEGSAIRATLKLTQAGLISLGGGFPAPELFDVAGLRAAAEQALQETPIAALQYGVTEGDNRLREMLAALTQSRGAHALPQDLIVTTGSQQGIDLLGKVMLDPGDQVIVERPTYLSALQIFRLNQVRILDVSLDNDGLDPDEVEHLFQAHRPKLLYTVPTFGNPSGAVLSVERRRRLLELAVQYRVLLVEDDPYSELSFGPAPPPLLALADEVPGARDWCVYLSSLSKILAPGLRIGWMVAPAAVLERVTVAKQGADAHTSTFAQLTAAHYLQAGHLPLRLGLLRTAYARRAAVLSAALRSCLPPTALSFHEPRGGMFLWASLSQGVQANDLLPVALERGVAFVPGAPFYADQPDPLTLRLSYATPPEDELAQAALRLAGAVSALSHSQGVIP
ncbi:PLP-dependent aminotransferase family protein [Deinococcus oregonensis]|uniref:PLP-dependent aminotransferase family protein n=1 Tax=Deinococcus oregonensis TaxID=1805970 RepID=A0ABV6AVU6_9DEIO